jgi:beta-lactamase superfamily II metal-dependent hydrolase
VFKAGDGDSHFIRCTGPDPVNILIDGGRGPIVSVLRKFLETLPDDQRQIDLFVITHIDADHITGALEILNNRELSAIIKDVWFNHPNQVLPAGLMDLSTKQGDDLGKILANRRETWNRQFKGGSIAYTASPDGVQIGSITKAYVLGPDRLALEKLLAKWPGIPSEEVDEIPNGVVSMGLPDLPDVKALSKLQFVSDTSVFNASSIALAIVHGDHVFLATADSHPADLVSALSAFLEDRRIAVATLPHHGSRRNFSPDLAELLKPDCWIISTDGSKHRHPHQEAVARLLMVSRKQSRPTTIVFNHCHPQASVWDNISVKADFNYVTRYPKEEDDWITVRLESGGLQVL